MSDDCPVAPINICQTLEVLCVTSVHEHFPSKDKDCLFNGACHPKSQLLADPPSEPVVSTDVLVNQVAPHLSLLSGSITKIMPRTKKRITFTNALISLFFFEGPLGGNWGKCESGCAEPMMACTHFKKNSI
jgi:hypothetical protein